MTAGANRLEALHERLVDEVRKIRTGADWRAWLDVAAKLHSYSFRNIILIMRQRPDATTIAGYRTWQRLGRQVNKGEKGIEIFAPVTKRRSAETGNGELSDPDPAPTARRMIGVRRAFVWDISQTSGPDLPSPPQMRELTNVAPDGLWDKLADQVAAADYTLEVESLPEGAPYGYADFKTRKVVVADRLGSADAVATLAHEAAHMLMHDPSDFPDSSTRSCRGVREVEAESVAYLVSAHFGMPTDHATFPYVATWAARSDKAEPERVVQDTGQRVVTTSRRLIKAMSETDDHTIDGQSLSTELSPSKIDGRATGVMPPNDRAHVPSTRALGDMR